MNILLTGAGGLIGSSLLPELNKDGHNVFTVSNSIKDENNIAIDFAQEWNTNLLPQEIDCIIHLAQSENFRDFPEKATDIFYTNTLSTLKLIDWAKKNNVKKFIFASSAGIYGNSDEEFNEESEIIYKSDFGFYLGTKHCSEVILDNYTKLLNVIQLRFFFVYGKEQRKGMLIPRLIDNIKNAAPLMLQGENGIKINPIHVSDAVKAIIKAMTLQESDKFNIGGDEVLSLRQIAETIGNVFEKSPEFLIQDLPANNLIGDITKMKKYLHTPQINFVEGIKQFK